MTAWETHLPLTRGHLPGGVPIPRTDPGGTFDATILFLGVYPAAKVARVTVRDCAMNLPVQVERTSFELDVSASARDIDSKYLDPLDIGRDDVLLVDVMPYFLANTRRDGKDARTMWENIRRYELLTEDVTGIQPRPSGAKLVKLARSMPGNLERLTEYFARCQPELVLTLGIEPAAVVRNETYGNTDRHKKRTFYADPLRMEVFGQETWVVHLVHPGLLMSEDPKTRPSRFRVISRRGSRAA